MSAIALAEWESFVSRLFKKDLDTNGWFVEFIYADETDDSDAGDSNGANDNIRRRSAYQTNNFGIMSAEDDDLADFDFIWEKRRRG